MPKAKQQDKLLPRLKPQKKEVIAKVKNLEDQLTQEIINVIDGLKIENIIDKKASENYFASRVIIGTGSSARHIAGSVEKVAIMLKQNHQLFPDLDVSAKEWVILLCGSIALHLMTKEKREHYNLE